MKTKWVRLWVLAALAGLILWRGLGFVDKGIRPHHEGTTIYPACLVKDGARPLSDVVIQHPPATVYLYAAALTLGGDRLLVTRYLTLVGVVLLVMLVALLVAEGAPVWWAGLIALLWGGTTELIEYLFLPWSTHWGLACFLTSVWLASRWCSTQDRGTLFWSGLWLGACILFRVNLGITGLLVMPFVVGLIARLQRPEAPAEGWQTIKRFVGPAAVTAGIGGAVMALHVGDLKSLWRAVDFQGTVAKGRVFSLAECFSLDEKGLITGGVLIVVSFLVSGIGRAVGGWRFGMGLFCAGVCGVLTWARTADSWIGIDPYKTVPGILAVAGIWLGANWRHRGKPAFQRILVVGAAGVVTWTINYPLPGVPQAMWASASALAVISQILYFDLPSVRSARLMTIGAAIWIALLAVSTRSLSELTRRPGASDVVIEEGFYRGMKGDAAWVQEYREMKRQLDQVSRRGDPILIWRMESLHYRDLERSPAVLPILHLDRFISEMRAGKTIEAEMLAKLNTRPPKAILVDTHRKNDASPSWYLRTHREIAGWIITHYAERWESQGGQYCLLTPKRTELTPAEEGIQRLLLDMSGDTILEALHETVERQMDEVFASNRVNIPQTPSNEREGVDRRLAALRELPQPARLGLLKVVRGYLTAAQVMADCGTKLGRHSTGRNEMWLRISKALEPVPG